MFLPRGYTLIARYSKSIDQFFLPRLGINMPPKKKASFFLCLRPCVQGRRHINVDKVGKVVPPVAKIYPILDINLTLPKG